MPTSVQTLEKLKQALSKIDRFKTSIYLLQGDIIREAQVSCDQRGRFIRAYWLETPGLVPSKHEGCDDLSEAFRRIDEWSGPSVTIYPQSMLIEGENGDEENGGLYHTVQQTWSECISKSERKEFGTTTPLTFREALLKDLCIPNLLGGEAGIKKFNDQQQALQKLNWDNSQFSGKVLKQANFSGFQLDGSNFDGANLEQVNFSMAKLAGANFCGAKLGKARLTYVQARRAKFSGASMKQCKLEYAELALCDFTNADLTKANMRSTHLEGADLSKAVLTEAQLGGARYDETTQLPPQPFPQWSTMWWTGNGADPFKAFVKAAFEKEGCKTFEDFKTHVTMNFDGARLTNAFKMLKKERFQLFAEVDTTHLVGVVKSQTNPDLVYACELTSDGSFFCGTQNLKPCGGLSGALCKHLLVLTIGLSRSGQIDLTDATRSIIASTDKSPKMNKTLMTELFLKYKGVEAGEVDWRPTETIPEDYYAY